MLTKEKILSELPYLDAIATQVMKEYIRTRKPSGFADSVSISKIAYKQALAMLNTRENDLMKLSADANLLKNKES